MHYFANSNPLPHIFIIYERVLIHVLEMQVLMCIHYAVRLRFLYYYHESIDQWNDEGGGEVSFTFIQDYIENKLCYRFNGMRSFCVVSRVIKRTLWRKRYSFCPVTAEASS